VEALLAGTAGTTIVNGTASARHPRT